MPKVSICIPIYNVENYIEQCCRSLFEQTLEDIEYIFVDDASPDRSVEILANTIKDYPFREKQIKIVHHKINRGLSAARKTALQYVTGKYVIHCDSDDWVDLQMYETLFEIAEKYNADVCISPRHYIDDSKDMRQIETDLSLPTREKIIKGMFLGDLDGGLCWNLWRREIATNCSYSCPDNISMNEDMRRTLQMLFHANVICICYEQFYHYRTNHLSMTHIFKRSNDLNVIENMNFYEDLVVPIIGEKLFYSCQRQCLFHFIIHNSLSSLEWYALWWRAKIGIFYDRRYSIFMKIIFILAVFFYKPTAHAWSYYRTYLKKRHE